MINNINLENEINNILSNSVEEEFPAISATLHTPKDDYVIDYIVTLDIERDFESALTDIVFLDCIIPMGDYINEFYKFKSKLEITLCFKRGHKQNCNRYKALILNVDKNINSSKIQSLDTSDLNNINVIELKLQLIPIELILIKKLEHEGIYHNIKRDEVVKQSMLYEFSKVKIYGNYLNLNYNIVESDIPDKLETVILPTGTKVAKIPHYVQDKYGLYNFNVNSYFRLDNDIDKNMYIWVYPTVDFNRVNKEQNIGYIYNTVKTGISATEQSYYLDNHQLKLITDTSEITGDDYNSLFNSGKGVEYQKTTDNIQTFNYDIDNKKDNYGLNKKVLTVFDKDGMDNTTNIGLTDNERQVNCLLNMNKIAYVQVVIYNFTGLYGSDPLEELIYPGMPFYYIYNKQKDKLNKTMKLPGIITKQHITFQILQKTMSSVILLGVKKPLMMEG